jgi:hypothetical protein
MSEAIRTLRDIHSSFSPSLRGRVLVALLFAVGIGAAASPLAGPWIFVALVPVLLIGAVCLNWSLRSTGLRGNNYAPMRTDGETPVSLGGSMEEPRSPNRRLQTMAMVAVPAVYPLVAGGQFIPSPTGRWGYAGVVAVIVFVVLVRAFFLEASYPGGYVPPTRLFAGTPDWSPANDAEAVAAVLHALQAVPGGRQVRRDVLTTHARPLTSTPQDDAGVDAGLDALTARGLAVVLRERKSSSLVVEWVVLTDDGHGALVTGR